MNSLLSTLIVLAGVAQSPKSAVEPSPSYPVVRSDITVAQAVQQVRDTGVSTKYELLGDLPLWDRVRDAVLVVPTPELPVDSLADLTEDLAVMCRIFDKALPAGRASVGVAYNGYGIRGDALSLPFGPQSPRTQGLYLDGYGALFFIPVNYPLAPTEPPEPAQAQPKESADTVWSQTIREMSGQPADEGQTERTAPVYDAQRVETLKKTLIKSLAHASNIRMRRPQDVITLVVGALDDAGGSGYGRYRTVRPAPKTAPAFPGKPEPRHPARSLLVLRVTKADVDALSKGQLVYADFANKVQTLRSSIDQSMPTTAPPTPGRR